MESFTKGSEKVQGVEVLFFEEAELKKVKGFANSFATVGPLSVLHFKDYNRYVLEINDWKYPLLRRLPVIASDKNELSSATYILPALNGFAFTLTITKVPSSQAIGNFESILQNNCNFSIKGEDKVFRKLEASPDDKLARFVKKEPTTKEIITDTVKDAVDMVKEAAQTIKEEAKGMTYRKNKKRIDLTELKNKNFKKTAHPSVKKGFVKSSGKSTQEFLRMRRENPNNIQSRGFEEIHKVDATSSPSLWIAREDLEEAILKNKDLAATGKFFQPVVRPKMEKGLVDIVQETFSEIKDYIVGKVETTSSISQSRVGQGPMEAHSRPFAYRNVKPATTPLSGQTVSLESTAHYQG